MNRQPYGAPPKWWEPKLSPLGVRLSQGYRASQLRRKQRLMRIDTEGLEHARRAIAEGKGVLIVANHSAHYDAATLYVAADRIRQPLYFMTAWQVFGVSNSLDRWFMQRLGCFSVDRESNDRQAYKQAVRVLQKEPHPLVIFPEGDVYHVTDRVSPFREGAAAIALSAAKRSTRPVVVIPCGIKFWYIDDPTEQLLQTMIQLEERVLIRTQKGLPLVDRIYRMAEAVMALKEIDYLGATRSGSLRERIDFIIDAILGRLGSRYELKASDGQAPERVKALRQSIIRQAQQRDDLPSDRGSYFRDLEQDMDDLFFVIQLYSYPGDYLRNQPTIERMAETIDKLEEDILGLDWPTVRGRRRVEIRFGEPLEVKAGGDRRGGVSQLTGQMRGAVQGLIDSINQT